MNAPVKNHLPGRHGVPCACEKRLDAIEIRIEAIEKLIAELTRLSSTTVKE